MVRQVDAFISRSRFFFFYASYRVRRGVYPGYGGGSVVYLLTDRVKEAKKTV